MIFESAFRVVWNKAVCYLVSVLHLQTNFKNGTFKKHFLSLNVEINSGNESKILNFAMKLSSAFTQENEINNL